jgi:hypothetical protein
VLLLDRALVDLGHLSLPLASRDLEELLDAVGRRVGRGGANRPACRRRGPREVAVGALLKDVHGRLAGALVVDGARERGGLVLLEDAGALAAPLVDLEAVVENEGVALVELVAGERHLDGGNGLLGALDVEQTRLVLLGLDVGEADSTPPARILMPLGKSFRKSSDS